ncbi:MULTISPECIES: iron ABC transporter permease [Ramlibacter]|uniref:Iron ABC transporter permease n=1 Tax=Ramlibacter aquaticus TaxID=2780094 RepID=A0ABR9SJC5_9BURK|nr:MULTISPECIES: iron ABC transporter permease [Ramlibacter]MBE7942450.1 iron ABC transporter permease [Ramlibacter aquaticus]
MAIALGLIAALLLLAGAGLGSEGWQPLWGADDAASRAILWDIRLPRAAGAWCAGGLLGLAGAIAQGLFRNPLADPYLLGSASGAALGVAGLLVLSGLSPMAAAGWAASWGLTGAAFAGALGAVLTTLALARGVQQTLRLLLAGVVVAMVFGALASLLMYEVPEILRSLQSFMLGTTSFIAAPAAVLMAGTLALGLALAVPASRTLDALALGESTARSLGTPVAGHRALLVAVMALATAAAVAQVGLVAFIGLVAPHVARGLARPTHRWLLPLAALVGGVLLLAADVAARWLLAPREVPVGILTAVLGGGYLLWLMNRRPGR